MPGLFMELDHIYYKYGFGIMVLGSPLKYHSRSE